MMSPTHREIAHGDDKPRSDEKRVVQEAIIEDAAETGDSGRDLVHGEGGTIELPTRPGDLSRDD
jgi:hypothetical protein